MPKKRKSEYSGLDEVEKTLHTSFCTAANSISHLYTQAQQQQKQSFHAGERHAVEKLYFWLLREHQAGSNISVGQILGYLQNELEGVSGDDTAMSPGPQSAQQQQQAVAIAAGSVGTSRPGQIETPAAPLDQSRRTGVGLEQHANLGWEEDQGVAPYHDASATAGLGFHPTQQQQQGGDGHSFGANDASMDMHGGGVGDGYFH
ncbi:hypothetical protein CY35_16G024700 [Sphagnum magellanicum]|nr:hypothetical protein CY35_16G024700 [Sphagnum magellanicum]KAH9536924.1 hypothetical protein CY35_16G024700 [Sphagnum magellanicum]